MATEDWVGIIVPHLNKGHEVCTEVYRDILTELGIYDVEIVEPALNRHDYSKLRKLECERVADIVDLTRKKPLIIGRDHELMTYAVPMGKNVKHPDCVYFDAHNDDWPPFERDGTRTSFDCTTFITYMSGRHFVVGIGEGPMCNNHYENGIKSVKLRHYEAKRILEQPISPEFFLSVDIDVMHPSLTKAHRFKECNGLYPGKMNPEQIKGLISELLKGRELIGMNNASYCPYRERPDFATADLIVDIMKPFL